MKLLTKIAGAISATSTAINAACLIAATLFLVAMLGLVTLQIVARYGFSSPPQWTEEAARYAMIWMGLLGASVAFYRRADPALIEYKEGWTKHRKLMARLGRAITAISFSGPLTWYGFEFVKRYSLRTSESLEINSGVVVVIVPIFACIIIFHAVADSIDAIFGDGAAQGKSS